MPVLLQNESILYKGKVMTVTCHLANTPTMENIILTYRNVIRVDCDGETVAIHFYNLKREVESAFYELGNDSNYPVELETLTNYEVTI
jgi:hypothetical protein